MRRAASGSHRDVRTWIQWRQPNKSSTSGVLSSRAKTGYNVGMIDFEFVVLGSGTSAGVPVIGCDCAACGSSDPRDRRFRASLCLRFVDATGVPRVVIFDTGPDLRQQALGAGLRRCDAVFFTHDHVDHTFGLDDVRAFNALMANEPIAVYAERSTMDGLRRVYRHIFRSEENTNQSWVAKLDPFELRVGEQVDRFGLRFTPLRLLHGKLPILGFRIDALDASGQVRVDQPRPLPFAYCTDVSVIPDETRPVLEGLDTVILDLLRYRPHATHMNDEQAVAEAQRIGARETWFTHMTHDIVHADLDAKLPEGMALAYDGLVLRG